MRTGVVLGTKTKHQGQQAAFAKQTRERRSQLADGGVHTVDKKVHTSRTEESSDASTVVKPPLRRWKRASSLPVVPDHGGYSYRWRAIDARSRGDQRGVAKRLQEGWELVKASDLPKYSLPTQLLDRRGEFVGNGDMVLMRIHEDMLAQRNESYENRRDTVTEAMEQEYLQHSDERMPIRRKASSRTEFVQMRRKKRAAKAQVADDEDV